MQSVLITGGAGFIGQNLVHQWCKTQPEDRVVLVDAMTYAANVSSLEPLIADRRVIFVKGDIGDAALMRRLFDEYRFSLVLHLAAESHVDRSIADPGAFLQTNVIGTFTLLKTALDDWRARGVLADTRFLHVSTDEVYGSLERDDSAFIEDSPYRPNSPYAASKASSDHLVRSFVATYGINAIITNCSNNYGPYQHPEKLIPLMIIHALQGKQLPIYGDGSNVRDWLHVSDHCAALMAVIKRGHVGETYNVGGGNEYNNREVVELICDLIDSAFEADKTLMARFLSCPAASGKPCRMLITFVNDRPGHDQRYAVNSGKLARDLGLRCSVEFRPGLAQTVEWYLNHETWWRDVTAGTYKSWLEQNYGARSSAPGIQLHSHEN